MELFGITISKFDNNTNSQECNYIHYSTQLHKIKPFKFSFNLQGPTIVRNCIMHMLKLIDIIHDFHILSMMVLHERINTKGRGCIVKIQTFQIHRPLWKSNPRSLITQIESKKNKISFITTKKEEDIDAIAKEILETNLKQL